VLCLYKHRKNRTFNHAQRRLALLVQVQDVPFQLLVEQQVVKNIDSKIAGLLDLVDHVLRRQ
jgi:hypothetical protein